MFSSLLIIYVLAVCCILCIAAVFCNAFIRKPSVSQTDEGGISGATAAPEIHLSVILTVHDNAPELERHLPLLLEQEYAAGYEVIVVDESSTDDTADVLKRLKARYPHLYTTFIPESSHYLSRRKLALTIGVKAAKNEWLLFTDADCHPESPQWLRAMASHCTDDVDIVTGYCGYDSDAPAYWRYERLLTACYQMRRTLRGTAYRYEGHNLAIRKSVFLQHNGFLSNLKYLRGEYDLMVNEYAEKGRTAIAQMPEARIRQECPHRTMWINSQLYYMETRRHLRRSWWNRIVFNVDMLLLHLSYLLPIAAAIALPLPFNAIAAGACLLSLLLRIIIVSRAAHSVGEHFPFWQIPFLELSVVWCRLWLKLKYALSDHADYIRK